MKARDIMTQNPRVVTPETSVQEAARLMKSEDAGVLPVVESEGSRRLVGMITDRDIAIRVVAEGGDLNAPVGEIASRDLVTIDPQQSIEEGARIMGQHQLRRLPVVEEDGKLVGILAQADVAQSGHDQLTGEVVEKISQ